MSNSDDFVSVQLEDFSNEGIGRAILDFIGDDEAICDLVAEASRRKINLPDVEVRDEAKFFEFVAALAGLIERSRTGNEQS